MQQQLRQAAKATAPARARTVSAGPASIGGAAAGLGAPAVATAGGAARPPRRQGSLRQTPTSSSLPTALGTVPAAGVSPSFSSSPTTAGALTDALLRAMAKVEGQAPPQAPPRLRASSNGSGKQPLESPTLSSSSPRTARAARFSTTDTVSDHRPGSDCRSLSSFSSNEAPHHSTPAAMEHMVRGTTASTELRPDEDAFSGRIRASASSSGLIAPTPAQAQELLRVTSQNDFAVVHSPSGDPTEEDDTDLLLDDSGPQDVLAQASSASNSGLASRHSRHNSEPRQDSASLDAISMEDVADDAAADDDQEIQPWSPRTALPASTGSDGTVSNTALAGGTKAMEGLSAPGQQLDRRTAARVLEATAEAFLTETGSRSAAHALPPLAPVEEDDTFAVDEAGSRFAAGAASDLDSASLLEGPGAEENSRRRASVARTPSTSSLSSAVPLAHPGFLEAPPAVASVDHLPAAASDRGSRADLAADAGLAEDVMTFKEDGVAAQAARREATMNGGDLPLTKEQNHASAGDAERLGVNGSAAVFFTKALSAAAAPTVGDATHLQEWAPLHLDRTALCSISDIRPQLRGFSLQVKVC